LALVLTRHSARAIAGIPFGRTESDPFTTLVSGGGLPGMHCCARHTRLVELLALAATGGYHRC
jgi:hypothetical protein